ncbi:MAG: type II secretion system protein GspG [Phycisphaerales bacterium]
MAEERGNTLGLAGFICALIGFACTGGLLSPIGLILSLIALKDRPKGFAIAGVVLGALGSCGIIITLLLFPVVILSVLVAAGVGVGILAPLLGNESIAQFEMAALDRKIGMYEQANAGSLPPDLASLDGASEGLLTDPWGNAYVFDPGTPGTDRPFLLFSKGEDGVAGTADDVVFLQGDVKIDLRDNEFGELLDEAAGTAGGDGGGGAPDGGPEPAPAPAPGP